MNSSTRLSIYKCIGPSRVLSRNFPKIFTCGRCNLARKSKFPFFRSGNNCVFWLMCGSDYRIFFQILDLRHLHVELINLFFFAFFRHFFFFSCGRRKKNLPFLFVGWKLVVFTSLWLFPTYFIPFSRLAAASSGQHENLRLYSPCDSRVEPSQLAKMPTCDRHKSKQWNWTSAGVSSWPFGARQLTPLRRRAPRV